MGSFLDSTFPVLVPNDAALFLPDNEFEAYVFNLLGFKGSEDVSKDSNTMTLLIGCGKPTLSDTTSTSLDTEDNSHTSRSHDETTDPSAAAVTRNAALGISASPFMAGLLSYEEPNVQDPEHTMRTDNNDLAIKDTKSPLVDLFFELEDVISGDQLALRLEAAWKEDAVATMKIIFNARSIHLGKSSRVAFYKACGWLAEHHPRTLLRNLPWLVRPVVPNARADGKAKKERDSVGDGNDAVMVQLDGDMADETTTSFNRERGGSHGYWKDLLNLLVLAVNDQLTVNGDPRSVLNVHRIKPHERDWTPASERHNDQKRERHDRAMNKFREDSFYRVLHLTISRLFAEQLKADKALHASGQPSDLQKISLAAKWAPTSKEFHDKHTFLVSSIAEILHPREDVCPEKTEIDREIYLKHARVAYQKFAISPLRKTLEVVERDLSAKTYAKIKYQRVPSLAMNRYSNIFATKDFERFDKYIESVAAGKRKISGATLLPSTLIHKVRDPFSTTHLGSRKKVDAAVQAKLQEIDTKVLDGQWNTLVNRIKDSGTLESSIAVCDVSGSMTWPTFPDGTTPMDSAIGLSLLLAEVTAKPFGGSFITFSANPTVEMVGGPDDKRSLRDKVEAMESTNWNVNTDFVAVFERLILPMALKNNLTQVEMVKQVFVFSDMHFDNAHAGENWNTSFERIKHKFSQAGYEMPRLVFWNLAGGRSGRDAPKPVDADQDGTALVSGYSQAQLKVFLAGEGFEADEEELDVKSEDGEDEDGDGAVKVTKKVKMDPLTVVKKAISHQAYAMLTVVD